VSDVFLVGFTLDAPAYSSDDLSARLEAHGATVIRDWSSVTADDTRWGIVLDAPNALSLRALAGEPGVEITSAVRLVPDRSVVQPVGDWATTLSNALPGDPPPLLTSLIEQVTGEPWIHMTVMPDVKSCGVCGWIGAHDPSVDHSSV
jgi:hypothetical protein